MSGVLPRGGRVTIRVAGGASDVFDRRSVLRALAGASAVAVAGCSTADTTTTREFTDRSHTSAPPTVASDSAETRPWEFDSVVDLVEAGADPTGADPIDGVLDAAAAENALLVLPEGRYRVTGEFVPDVSALGLLGRNATIVPGDGFDDTVLGLGYPEPMTDVFVAGLTFDFTASNTGGRPLLAKASDRVRVRDLTVRGAIDIDQDAFRFDVTDSDGTGVVERVSLPDGAPARFKNTGIEVGDDNAGDIDFRDCRVAGFPDNGLYADPPEGRVRVLGGTFLNNGVAGVRVEADDALVRGVHVRCDTAVGGENMRGVWLRGGSGVVVEDSLVELLDVTESDGAVTFAAELESGTLRRSTIRVDADGVNAIRVKSAASEASRSGPFVVDTVTVTGSAAESTAVRAADRAGVQFRDLCIHGPGRNRAGFTVSDLTGTVANARIAVTGDAFDVEDSQFDRRDVTLLDASTNPCR